MTSLTLDGHNLKLADLRDLETARPSVSLSTESRRATQASVDTVRKVIDTDQVCYGINTGFGALARQRISRERLCQLQ